MLAVTFVAFGVWVAVAPGSVSGLVEPDDESPGMNADGRDVALIR